MKTQKGSIFIVIIAGALLAVLTATGFFWWQNYSRPKPNFPLIWEDCIKTPGARILQTYPEQCILPDGQKLIQPISDADKKRIQPPEETATWKLYNRVTYQIKIPPVWRAELPPKNQGDKPTNFSLTSWYAPDNSYLRIEYFDAGGKNLNQYLVAQDKGRPDMRIVSSKTIVLDNQAGLQRQEQSSDPSYMVTVSYVTSGKNIFIISAIPSTNSSTFPAKPEVFEKYDQILLTLKFL